MIIYYKYEDTEAYPAQDIPQYTLYDFDKDNIPELLIWDILQGTASWREIFVYKYNTESKKSDKIGTMLDFAGHSEFGESKDKDGIVISTRDSGKDAVKKYTLKNGKIVSETLLSQTNETPSEWIAVYASSEYFGSIEYDFYYDLDHLNEVLG